jgi:periplasmic copper chaperone A
MTRSFTPVRSRATRWRLLPPTVLAVATACATAERPQTGREVTDAWARTADSGATGGAYVTIVNADSMTVELTGASSAWAVATEVHETMDHNGMTHMMPRSTVSIAPRDSLVMKPGGLHIMLVQLTRALTVNDSIPVTLRFSRGDSLQVRVPVRAP